MDPFVATIVMRFIERLIVVLGACLAIYCGYRLFLAMPSRERGTGKLELPGGVSIHVSRIGPGVFFSLFGAAILAMSFHYGVAVELPANTAVVPDSAVVEGKIAPARATFSGISDAPPVEPKSSDVVAASIDIQRLNRAAVSLDPGLDRYVRSDIQRSLRVAKLALMRANWSPAAWGDQAKFVQWIQAGEPVPPPDAIAGAVKVYGAMP